MKHINPGKEFDAIAGKLLDKNTKFILWGAANIGYQFYEAYREKINIIGIVDSDKEKQNNLMGNCEINSPDILNSEEDYIVIVTTSAFESVKKDLNLKGFRNKENFIDYFLFVKIYEAYSNNFLVSGRLDISITEKCTLKCKKCNMFMTYFKEPKDSRFDDIIKDIDSYFSVVDYIVDVNLLGGEPLIYKQLKDIIEYLKINYNDRIKRIKIFTNGTLLPDQELIDVLRKYNIIVQISDYTNRVDYKKRLQDVIKLFEDNDIQFYILKSDVWGDFGFPENPNTLIAEGELIPFFDTCKAPFRGLYNKKVYFCHLETSAIRAGLYENNENDYFDLLKNYENIKKSFLEFDEGFSKKGYITFCSKCRGCSCVNDLTVYSAIQLK